jgi:hypothetical protein
MLPSWLVDGCTLVILRRGPNGFVLQCGGELHHSGQKLTLVTATSSRAISPQELAAFKLVTDHCQIHECHGFDFFVVEDVVEKSEP